MPQSVGRTGQAKAFHFIDRHLKPVSAFALLLCSLLLAGYTAHVAGECIERTRGKALNFFSARLGSVAAVGTGLWAAVLMGALAPRAAAGSVETLLLYGFAAWLAAALAAGVALQAASLAVRRLRLAWAAASSVPLWWLALCSDALRLDGLSTLNAAHGALHAPGAVGLAAALAFALDQAARGCAKRDARRLGGVAAVALTLVGPLLIDALGADAPGTDMPSLMIAVAAGAGAAIVLALTRIVTRFESHLRGRADALASSLREANRNLQDLAYRDPLTRLSNRRRFDEKLAAAVAHADANRGRLTLMFIDLDGFKPVNDGFGHAGGDRVLRAVGERLRKVAPRGCLIARIGGDEFALLVRKGLAPADASMIASRVLVALRDPFAISDNEVALSASIGIAVYPDCGAADRIVACGDAAMYTAKRAGGGHFVFFEPGMGSDARLQAELKRDLRRAIEHEQFELYYQPKIDAESGMVTAVEALLRWNHPQRGLVTPDHFIPLAEQAGLISAIGDWVFERVCWQIAQWQGEGVRMRVAVNLSAQQLMQPGLISRVEHVIQRHRVAPELLTFEVTETTAMGDPRNAQRALVRLGRLGVHISIDDFGTGYSSLAYLRQLPATELKIDRQFVADVATSNDARAIVEAVIRLAHALDLRVVAEGVETKAQRDVLRTLGCNEFQGYLFAKPLPAHTMLQWALAERERPRTFRPSLFMHSAAHTQQ